MIENAVTGAAMARVGNEALDVQAMLAHARNVGGANLRKSAFLGQHICTPLRGVAVHINAFNFPV
ncbi:hypothetical protein So717_24610 [Roseobacter cerasinus]|uniref:Uncharacterized protein n=1 Tax=Roseobacter cerasinus TaxID=2602289 RepID=A0A640VQL7_9RHOB|nr:hypothetical protein So717_24610 [Roseobacter cerasinus]